MCVCVFHVDQMFQMQIRFPVLSLLSQASMENSLHHRPLYLLVHLVHVVHPLPLVHKVHWPCTPTGFNLLTPLVQCISFNATELVSGLCPPPLYHLMKVIGVLLMSGFCFPDLCSVHVYHIVICFRSCSMTCVSTWGEKWGANTWNKYRVTKTRRNVKREAGAKQTLK